MAEWHESFDWVDAPEVFEIESDQGRLNLVRFLRTLRDLALGGASSRVRINFASTKAMTAAGTLLFAAELDRMCKLGSHRIGCSYPQDPVVAQVLQHVGVFATLGQSRRCRITAANVRYWKVDTGEQVVGQQAATAMKRYSHLFPDSHAKPLYRALTEAMTNCRHHAYEEPRGDGFENIPNWWMFSQHRDGRLTVAFCDLGMGIPRSLPTRPTVWESVKKVLSLRSWRDDDANRIRAAVAAGASRTRKEYRGKGLMDMRSVLDGLKGRMQIHSNRGFYGYDAATSRETCENFDQAASIQGTIVLWLIPV